MTTSDFFIDFLTTPAAALAEVSDFLHAHPVELNLFSTILTNMIENGKEGRFWVVRDNTRAIVGLGLQAPETRPMNISSMPPGAAWALADVIHGQGIVLPGVGGAVDAASRFAGRWTELSNSGAKPTKALRIYEQRAFDWSPPQSGRLRPFGEYRVDLAIQWMLAFFEEIGEPLEGVEEFTRFRVSKGLLHYWDNAGPRCLIGHTQPLNGVARIQAAYTPKAARGRGYMTNTIGTLSDRLAQDGIRRILFTDLENPTSNKIYRDVGYRSVLETLIYAF